MYPMMKKESDPFRKKKNESCVLDSDICLIELVDKCSNITDFTCRSPLFSSFMFIQSHYEAQGAIDDRPHAVNGNI